MSKRTRVAEKLQNCVILPCDRIIYQILGVNVENAISYFSVLFSKKTVVEFLWQIIQLYTFNNSIWRCGPKLLPDIVVK
jgi:hypothetical protein